MATKIQVTGTLLGSLGLRDNTVTATLCDLDGTPRLGFVPDAESELVAKESTRTNVDGSWTLSLYGNDDIDSDYGDTIYRVTEGSGYNQFGSNAFYIGVPTSGGPYWVRDLTVTPPGGAAPESFAVVSVDGQTGVVDLSSRYLGLGGGTLTGALTLNADPVSALQPATKQYVDNHSASLTGGPFLALAGGTMTGAIVLPGNPSTALQAAPKQYVDNAVAAVSATYVDVAGDTMSGALTLSGAPTLGLHAATKTYVDNETTRATGAEALLAPKASPTFTGTVSGITKSMVGLGSVDNTADTAKPVSTAQQTALNLKADLASPTFTGTVNAAAVTTSGTVTVGGNLSVTGIGSIGYVRAVSNQNIAVTGQTASTALVVAVAANAEYWVEAQIIAQNTSGTWTPSWTGPSGATMKWNDTTTSTDYSSTIGATNNTYALSASVRMCFFAGILKTSSTAGNLTFTTNASAGTTVLMADSGLLLRRVA